MNYLIPLNYDLNIDEIYDIEFFIYDNQIIINNFILYYNKNNLIYRISSRINLINLLDFLNNYDNIIIKKIYYFLIIKYLLKLKKQLIIPIPIHSKIDILIDI